MLLGLDDVSCLRTLLAFHDLEFDRVAFLQALVALATDGAVMHENIRPIVTTNKPETFRIVEPFYGSSKSHFRLPPGRALQHPSGRDAVLNCVFNRLVPTQPRLKEELASQETCGSSDFLPVEWRVLIVLFATCVVKSVITYHHCFMRVTGITLIGITLVYPKSKQRVEKDPPHRDLRFSTLVMRVPVDMLCPGT
jgi:hypothetical protein